MLIQLVALAFAIAAVVCWFIILIDAFRDSILKGLFGLICGLYLLYYAIFDFEHENKLAIVIIAFGGSTIATGIYKMAM